MPLTKAADIAYVRFGVPDLDAAERWFDSFGLKRAARDERRLFMRGSGPSPFLYAAEQARAPAFLALGFRLDGMDDLKALAEAANVSIEALDAPGGGAVVRLADPDGISVEAVAQQVPAPRIERPRDALNSWDRRERLGSLKRLPAGPSEVVRLGHCVLSVSDFRNSEAWYKARFGFLTSDEIERPDGSTLGAFLRCDRGAAPTDHHTLFLMQADKPGFHHAAFEVRDFDDLMMGNAHLLKEGALHSWGVGRHILGSQIFDYWKDPYGFVMEHWTDGDLLTAAQPPAKATLEDLRGAQWGPTDTVRRM